jgi:hypothetical protein
MAGFGRVDAVFPLDPYDDPRPAARAKVIVPAIALMIMGVLSVVYVIGTSLMAGGTKAQYERQIRSVEKQSDMSPEQKKQFQSVMRFFLDYLPVINGLMAVCGAAIAIGGFQMITLSARWYCYVASILSMMPIITPPCCCCLGWIFGVWAIVVMNLRDVQAGFAFQDLLAKQK